MRGQATTPPLSCAKTKSALVWRKEEGMTGPHSKSTNVPTAALALPAVMPLPPTREMRSLADSAQLALDARMGRPTSIRAIGLAAYRKSLSASTAAAGSPPHTDQA
jgi:hypothetical protein